VKYTRCKIYSYAILNDEADESKLNTLLLPQIKTHYISCAAGNFKTNSLTEIKMKFNKVNALLPPRTELLGSRVIVSDINASTGKFDESQLLLKKLLQAGALYLFLENPNGLNDVNTPQSTCAKLKEIYSKQIEAARETKGRTGRSPLNEEIAAYTATLL
jgi:hypothetical protein